MISVWKRIKCLFGWHGYEYIGYGKLEFQKGAREKILTYGRAWICKYCGKEVSILDKDMLR